jgi:hypothetical protein
MKEDLYGTATVQCNLRVHEDMMSGHAFEKPAKNMREWGMKD